MEDNINKKSYNRKWLLMILPIGLLLSIAGWYHGFYRSKTVAGTFIKPDKIFVSHTAQVRGVRFSPDGTVVASGSVDSTVRIWNNSNMEVLTILKHEAGVTSLDFSPDGNYIVTGSYDGIVRIWRVVDGLLMKMLKGHQKTVWSVAFSPNGDMVAGSGEDASVILWEMESGKIISTLSGHGLTVWALKFSPDGKQIASSSFDATIKIWDTGNGKLVQTLNGHTEAVVDIAFNHEGNLLASTSDDKTIKLWRIPGGRLIRTLAVAEHVQAVGFSPDGKYLITGGRDKPAVGEFLQEIFGDSHYNKGVSMRFWNVNTGQLLQTLSEHYNDVNDVTFSADGKWIASASEDNTVRLWRVKQ